MPKGYPAPPELFVLNDRLNRPQPLADATGSAPQHTVDVWSRSAHW